MINYHQVREIDEDHLPRQPVRVHFYSDGFVSIDNEFTLSAFGPGALQAIARKLLAVGYDPDQELHVNRGSECINRVSLRDAANQGDF
jgi:hypothetical protein